MKVATLKNKVEAKLIKWGNNHNDVNEIIKEHFEYASNTYTTVVAIAECIVSLH